MSFETIKTKTIYQGRAFDVLQEDVRMPEGHISKLDVISHQGAVTILPIDANGDIVLIRQYRHPTGGFILELPAGTLEDDEPPEICAQREIREEIGMSAGSLQIIGQFFLAPGYSTEYMHVFLAQDIQPNPLPGDKDEYITVERIPVKQVNSMVESGKIQDGKTLAAFFLAQPYLDF